MYKNHECNLITDPRSRKAILRAKSKCFVCLRGNHRMNECQSKLVCFRCKQRHHVSICEQDDRNTQNNSNDLHEANENAENSAQNVSRSSVNFCNAENNVILLKRAKALISSKNNNREEKICILFDTGAQSSFIGKEISEKLNLPIVRKQRRFIQTFEDKNAEPRILMLYKLK